MAEAAKKKKGAPGPLLGTLWWTFTVGLVASVAARVDCTALHLLLGGGVGLSSLGLALADALVGDDLLVGGRYKIGHADAAQGGTHLAGVDGVGNVLDLRGIQCADWYLRVCL